MYLRDRNVVVTGGAGLIGSFLTERLVAAGARVVVADDFSKGRREFLANVIDAIEIREGDLEDVRAMDRALDGAEIVFHLASRAFGIGYSAGNHLRILDHNERITNNLVQTVSQNRVEWLLVASSSCVYPDDGPEIISEAPLCSSEPEAANWGYGWAKRMLERKVQLLGRERRLPVTIVRPFNIYGERYVWVGNDSQAIPMLIKKIMDGDDPVIIWGSGAQRRNYLHAIDCADAMVGLVEANWSGVVNIGTEDTISMRELAEAICTLAGRWPQLIVDRTKPEGRPVKSADSTTLRKAYPGFSSSVAFDEGLRRMLGWYRASFTQKAG
jgi:UDP-glucose 4-epimerase